MTWNYRMVRTADTIALHEAHYDASGSVTMATEAPVPVLVSEGDDDMIAALGIQLDRMRQALAMPVVVFVDDQWIEETN